jgi:hypothetical protein
VAKDVASAGLRIAENLRHPVWGFHANPSNYGPDSPYLTSHFANHRVSAAAIHENDVPIILLGGQSPSQVRSTKVLSLKCRSFVPDLINYS